MESSLKLVNELITTVENTKKQDINDLKLKIKELSKIRNTTYFKILELKEELEDIDRELLVMKERKKSFLDKASIKELLTIII